MPEDPETLTLLMKVRPDRPTSGVRKPPSGIFGRKG